jgi:mannose/fructose/N-acetylgalactosamine-specific phosphotransferase system component IIC
MTNARSSGAPLWNDIRTGWLYAAWFSVIAVVILLFAVVSNSLGASRVRDVDQALPALPLIILGYFVAGSLGGIAFWLLRALGQSLIGWMLRGFVIAALVYSTIGVTGIIGFYFGVNILNLHSAAEGWRMLPVLALILGVFPGTLVGLYQWFQQRQSR